MLHKSVHPYIYIYTLKHIDVEQEVSKRMTPRSAMWIGVSMLQLATRLVASVLLCRIGGAIDWQRGACVPNQSHPSNGTFQEDVVVSRRPFKRSRLNKWYLRYPSAIYTPFSFFFPFNARSPSVIGLISTR